MSPSASSLFNLPACLISFCIILFADLFINSIVQGISAPIILQTILFALQLFAIICAILLKLILISQTMYLKMGSWKKVIKLCSVFLIAALIHFGCVCGMTTYRMYFVCRHVLLGEAWNDIGYYFCFYIQQFIAISYYVIGLRTCIRYSHEKYFYPKIITS